MAKKPTVPLIGGLDPSLFINRRIRVRSENGSQHAMPGTLKQVNGFNVVVRTINSNLDTVTSIDRIMPWWQENPDLKAQHDALDRQKLEENAAKNAAKLAELQQFEPDPDPVTTMQPDSATPDDTTTPPVTEAVPHASDGAYDLTIKPGADPAAWYPVLGRWIELDADEKAAETMRQEAQNMLDGVQEKRRAVAAELSTLGVTVTSRNQKPVEEPAQPEAPKVVGMNLFDHMVKHHLPLTNEELKTYPGFKNTNAAEVKAEELARRLGNYCPDGKTYSVRVIRDGRCVSFRAFEAQPQLIPSGQHD